MLTLPILWARLVSIADEAATTLVRTAFSTVLREANDYACVLLDQTGQAVSDNTWAIPAFIGAMPATMRHVLRKFPPETWQSGDVVMTNDPWIATGHLPDCTLVAPIFHRGELLGFAGSAAHQADMGGSLYSAETKELFEEGLRIPISHLYRAGQPTELIDIIAANVRVPEQVIGDLHAMIAASNVMSARVRELAEEEGLVDLGPLATAIQDRAETVMRTAIAGVPDGTYSSSTEVDGFDESLTISLRVTVQGSDMVLDYGGTSPQQARALNVPMVNTFAHSAYAVKCALDPLTPRNEGSYRPIKVVAPEGCLVNPRFPAPVNARHLIFLQLAAAIYQALSQVVPDLVTAESGSPFVHVIFSGVDDNRNPFVHLAFDSAGMGAGAGRDGLSATPFPNNTGGAPVEVVEAANPLIFWEKRLAPDSGGAGEYRGGLGTQFVVEALCQQPVNIALLGSHVRHPPRGLMGGRDGMPAQVLLDGKPMNPMSRLILLPGHRLSVRNAGGGGYGQPSRRRREKVVEDLANGYVTSAATQD